MKVTLDTVYLRPGTKITYLFKGQKLTESFSVEVEAELVSIAGETTYIIKWADADGGEATATEPAECP